MNTKILISADSFFLAICVTILITVLELLGHQIKNLL